MPHAISCPNGALAAFVNAPRQLNLHDYGAYDLLGHAGSRISALEVHEAGELAFTLDNLGNLLLWSIDQIAPEIAIPHKEVAQLPCCIFCQLRQTF